MAIRSHIPTACVAVAAFSALFAAQAQAKPNLKSQKVSNPPTSVQEGGSFKLDDTVQNVSKKEKAGKSDVRFYLAIDAKLSLAERTKSKLHPRVYASDVLLGGFRGVPALAAGAQSSNPKNKRTTVRVPVGTRPGLYYLLACSDDRGAVVELKEDDNCKVARKRVTVTALPGELVVDTLGDVLPEPTEQEDAQTLQQNKPLACAKIPTKQFKTLPAALKSVDSFLTRTAGADAMAGFRASPEYKSADAAEKAAGAAVALGQPGAALAALVRAHQLEPRQSSHLINGAAVASSVGLPNEALAMLDGAQKLDDPDRPALGIARQDVALANRGQALTLLGRYDEAAQVLQGPASEPLLAEARSTQATGALCRDKPDAVKLQRASRKRHDGPIIDPSRGVASKLRKLPLPGFPEQAAGSWDLYKDINNRVQGESVAGIGRQNTLETRIRAAEPTLTRAELKSRNAIYSLVLNAHKEGNLAAAHELANRQEDEITKIQEGFWGGGETGGGRYSEFQDQSFAACEGSKDPKCFDKEIYARCKPALNIAHQAWLDEMSELQGLYDSYFAALSLRESGYATNLGDDDSYQLALEQIRQTEGSLYHALVADAQIWSQSVYLFKDHCVDAPVVGTDSGAESGAAGGEGACSGSLKALSGVIELGDFKLKISCTRIQASIKEQVIPWVQAFAEVTYDIRAGSLTTLVGSKGEISGGGAKGTFKSGIYVTSDKTGAVDVGWRVGPSATVGKGPLEFEVYKDEIDISFIGKADAKAGR